MTNKRLYRSQTDSILGGVAGGLGEYFELDPALIRIIFVVLTLAGGSGVLLYLLLWIFLPTKADIELGAATQKTMEKNAKEIEAKAEEVAKKIKKEAPNFYSQHQNKKRNWLGYGLIAIGVLLLLEKFNILDSELFWPATLVILGIGILMR